MSTSAHVVYSNDLVVERKRQENAASTPDGPEARKPILINRIARAGFAKKVVMGMVAVERGDDDIAAIIREELEMTKGQKFDGLVVVRQSRREPVSKEFVALGGTTEENRNAVLKAEKDTTKANETPATPTPKPETAAA